MAYCCRYLLQCYYYCFLFFVIRRQQRSTRPTTLFPYPTLFRSVNPTVMAAALALALTGGVAMAQDVKVAEPGLFAYEVKDYAIEKSLTGKPGEDRKSTRLNSNH